MEKTLTAQKWESPPRGKHVLPVVVIGVAAAALVIGMNYQFKQDGLATATATAIALAPASKSIANESAPAVLGQDVSSRAVVVGPPSVQAPVAKPESARDDRPRAEPTAPLPRTAPNTIAPRAPAVPPTPAARVLRQEPARTQGTVPTPVPPVEPMSSGQAPQPLPELTAPQPVPIPAPLPSATPGPIGTN